VGKERDFYDVTEEQYVKRGKSLQEISELIGVSATTLSKWKAKGDWGKKRKDYLTRTRSGPVQRLRDKLFQLLDDTKELDAKTVDQISKIVAAIEKIDGGRDVLGSTIEVMDRFGKYIRENEKDEAFVGQLTEHMQGFFSHVKVSR
jgi:transcriptional regulator with XRE-family HTH domain